MVFSSDDIKNMLNSPIPANRWGSDTHKVISLIKKINDASCTSCAMRRNLSALRDIFVKYGDDIVYRPGSYTINTPKNRRIPCNDCVAKHLSQAYVLQSEFYQGYIEYLALIEAHLNEAYAECPPENADLRSLIRSCLRKVTIDRKPDIPLVSYTNHPEDFTKPVNVIDDKDDNTVSANINGVLIDELLSNTPESVLKHVQQYLSGHRYDVCVPLFKRSPDTGYNFGGHMAQAAEFIAVYCPEVSQILRERRIHIKECIINKAVDAIEPIWVENTDILAAIEKLLKNDKK